MAAYTIQLIQFNEVAFLLMVLGLVFMVSEIYIMSHGALGVIGVIALIVGSILLTRAGALGLGWAITLNVGITLIGILFVYLTVTMAIRARHRPIVSGRESLLGKKGHVEIDGARMWVRIDGERWQCHSDDPLQQRQRVVVKRVDGLILHVEPEESLEE